MAMRHGRPTRIDEDAVAAAAGDVDAFARLAEAHTGLIRTVVADHVRSAEDIADCVQETFARALRTVNRLRDPARFGSWLASIARHVAIDHRRRRARELAIEHPGDEQVEDLASSEPTPERTVARGQVRDMMRSHLRDLPTRDAAAVTLVTYLEHSPDEVAERLGVTTGNAKVIVHRARRRLRSTLVDEAFSRGDLSCHGLDADDGSPASEHLVDCPECHRQAHLALVSGY